MGMTFTLKASGNREAVGASLLRPPPIYRPRDVLDKSALYYIRTRHRSQEQPFIIADGADKSAVGTMNRPLRSFTYEYFKHPTASLAQQWSGTHKGCHYI